MGFSHGSTGPVETGLGQRCLWPTVYANGSHGHQPQWSTTPKAKNTDGQQSRWPTAPVANRPGFANVAWGHSLSVLTEADFKSCLALMKQNVH